MCCDIQDAIGRKYKTGGEDNERFNCGSSIGSGSVRQVADTCKRTDRAVLRNLANARITRVGYVKIAVGVKSDCGRIGESRLRRGPAVAPETQSACTGDSVNCAIARDLPNAVSGI